MSDNKRGDQFDRWLRALGEDDPDFIDRLKAQRPVWRVLITILKGMYKERHVAEYDFSDPAFQFKLAYSEGYKRALQDVYNLIPDQGEDL